LRLCSALDESVLDDDEEDDGELEELLDCDWDGVRDEPSAGGVVCGDCASASPKAPTAVDANIHAVRFMICLCAKRE
jgi:hypothetical protein